MATKRLNRFNKSVHIGFGTKNLSLPWEKIALTVLNNSRTICLKCLIVFETQPNLTKAGEKCRRFSSLNILYTDINEIAKNGNVLFSTGQSQSVKLLKIFLDQLTGG